MVVILPILPLVVWLSPRILGLVLGSRFEGTAKIVSLLVAATPLLFLNSLFLNRAIALRQKQLFTAAQTSAVVMGVLGAMLLAPRLGGLGIAFAALLRETTLFVFLLSALFLGKWNFA
jgi:O-antigen/teichoic acid export membrane protein